MTGTRLAALVLAVSLVAPPALGRAADLGVRPYTKIGTVRVHLVRGPMVDGVPVYYPENQFWTGRDWASEGSDDAFRALKGLRPQRYPRE